MGWWRQLIRYYFQSSVRVLATAGERITCKGENGCCGGERGDVVKNDGQILFEGE